VSEQERMADGEVEVEKQQAGHIKKEGKELEKRVDRVFHYLV